MQGKLQLMHIFLPKGILSAIFVFIFISFIISIVPHQVFGDGFTMENLPPASVGNRQVQLFIKLNPPILYSNSDQQKSLYFRWFDANTNASIQHVSMFITITKHDQLLMRDLFHTHTGDLTLNITPTNDTHWTIYADTEPFLGGWVNNQNQPIEVQAPILGEGGLYHINIEMFSIDYDKNIFDTTDNPKSVPVFDAYLSVGDVSSHDFTYNSNTYNTTVISYYDKINNDFNFDPSKLQISYSMPFDWNITRLQSQPVFVHEEIHIPKSFKEFTNTPTYTATLNGNPIVGRKLIVDPYSLGDTVIAHILLNKNDILSLAKTNPNGTNAMNFTLAPAAPNVQTSSSVLTDFGGWGINLGWSPTNLVANAQNNLKLTFFDAFTENQVTGNVNYDLRILDQDGNTIFSKTDLTAMGGVDTQTIQLPGNGIYRIEANIKSISYNGLPDTSRIGIGRGDLVIPSTVTNQNTGNQSSNQTGQLIIIPPWIKHNARWWSEGSIDDATFASGIQYLIKQGIIQIPTTPSGPSAPGVVIPPWVKNNAKWWAAGQIDDQTFAAGIQYLIKIGVISV